MAYVTKKELIEKINPLIDDLLDYHEELEGLLEEMDYETFDDVVGRLGRTLHDLKEAVEEAED
jgi:hypothetical protein